MSDHIEDVVLHEATRTRYLNYALSVITSRALPDVRDGLKPVQRRILYAMYQNLSLTPDAKHRKSAAVVGEVMAKYHPHGDQSIYDAMVRLAQDFTLRYPLVDGQGNFGSLDGDGAAAMRYTEAKLRHVAVELLSELKKKTVDYRQNYDGTTVEPMVLPAQVPNLLVNGAQGIAVGMATNIPSHNLREIVDALLLLIDKPDTTLDQLVGKVVKGPDFATGGEILNSRDELLAIYETGSGPVEVRGTWKLEEEAKVRQLVIDSIPWGLNKSDLITDIADHIRQGKVPQLLDIRDESTEDIRIVMELRRDASPDAAMAYLFKRTALQSRFNVNMTALCPSDDAAEGVRPRRLALLEMLELFLDFRHDVTRRRLEFDLAELERRIHILRGFEIIFNALDEAIAIIRASDGRKDAHQRLMARFGLDDDQTEAILETRLYKLAKLEIDAIRKELAEKEEAAARIREILASEPKMWALIRGELAQVRDAYGDKRKTRITGPVAAVVFEEENYIVAEDAFVILSRAGWIRRQKSYTGLQSLRVREGDAIQWVMPASSRESLVIFTDQGKAYTLRVADITQTTGYGDPVQAKFSFADGETIVGATVTDARILPLTPPAIAGALVEGEPPPPWILAVSRGGKAIRLSLSAFAEPSTVNGRTVMRLDKEVEGDAVTGVEVCVGDELVSVVSRLGRALIFPAGEVNVLAGPGKGVMAMKLSPNDTVLGFKLVTERMDGIVCETNRGRQEVVRSNKFSVSQRGGRGRELLRMGYIARILKDPVELGYRANTGAAADAGTTRPAATDDDEAPAPRARKAPVSPPADGATRPSRARPAVVADDDDDDGGSDPQGSLF